MEIGFPERSLFENKFDGSGLLTYIQTYKFSVFYAEVAQLVERQPSKL